jgi:hypothetical protein
MAHQAAADTLASMAFGHQDHADGTEIRALRRTVLRDHAGGHETAHGIVDAVSLPGSQEETPLVFLARPPPVLGQVGAGGEIAKRQSADGQSSEGRSRHAGQAV